MSVPYEQQDPNYGNQQGQYVGNAIQQQYSYNPQPQQPQGDDLGYVVGKQIQTPSSDGSREPLDPSGKYVVRYKGAFAAVEVRITATDTVKAEAGTMVTLSHNVDIDSRLEKNVGTSLLLCCCAGESFFFSHFGLKPGMGDRGDILLAPGYPGEIILIQLDGSTGWAVQKGAFMACDQSVNIGVIAQGLAKGCCSGLGFFIMEATGVGRLILAAYGSLIRYDVAPGEIRTVDTGFIVAWSQNMSYEIGKAATTYSASILSNEGFVARFRGPGTVFVQTRSLRGLASALRPYLPSGGGGGRSSSE